MSEAAIGILTNLLGAARVSTGADDLAYFSTDIAGEPTQTPVVIVRPHGVDEACRVVKLLTDLNVAVVPRGGGFSAHGGYQASGAYAILDLLDLDRIVEINEADRFVTVEAGCTWSTLSAALKHCGLRTPFFGPLTGYASTIGGAASSNSWFFGSGTFGTMADTVIGLDVVLADGSLVETGAAAAEGRAPFLRHFGPDLTGMFLGDCGAFGVKLRVTLPLIAQPVAEGYVSFAFERFEDIADAHAVLAREDVVAEQWGFDPEGNEALARAGFKFLEGVTFAHDPSPEYLDRLKLRQVDGHRTALRGGYSLHAVVEGANEREVETKLGRVRRMMMPVAIKELPNAIPQKTRENALRELAPLLGPAGENQLPAQGFFPLSNASTIVAVTEEYFIRHREELTKHDIRIVTVTGTVGNAFVLEPSFLWRDRLHAFHKRHAPDMGGKAPDANPAARAAVMRLRRDLIGLWGAYGAAYVQVGRSYPYTSQLSSAARAFVEAIKHALDPRGLMNPGALQLGLGAASKTSRKFAEFPQNLLEGR